MYVCNNVQRYAKMNGSCLQLLTTASGDKNHRVHCDIGACSEIIRLNTGYRVYMCYSP